jgi:hypothetical protein
MDDMIISMQSHLNCIEHQYQMSGLSDGVYAEYANDVAVAFAYDVLCRLKAGGRLSMSGKEIYDFLNDETLVKQARDK